MPSSDDQNFSEELGRPYGDLRFYLALTVLVVIVAVALMLGIVTLGTGNFAAAKYCVLFALAISFVIAYGLVVRFRRVDLASAIRTVGKDAVAGTEIRYAPWPFAILLSVTACFAIFCLMGAVEIPIHQDEGFPGGAVIIGALGLVFVSFLIAVASGRIRRGGITLSSKGITHRGWSFESHLDWPDVAGVTAAFNGTPFVLVIGYANVDWVRRDTTRLWRIDRLPPVPMIEFDCRQFDVDPRHLFTYVQAYVDNPELRGELGTEAAVNRARQPVSH